MRNDSVLQSAANLLAFIYNDLILYPLPEEHDLLKNAGNESAELLFYACRSVFGSNMKTAFYKVCVYVANYCESLFDHDDELFHDSNAEIIIDAANKNIAAIEYLAAYAPVDSIEERAIMDSLAYQSRSCYNHLLKRYRSYIRSIIKKE